MDIHCNRRLQSPWKAILEQPGPAQLQGQRGSCIPVTLGGVEQLKVELVPLAPCSRQKEGGREQDRHCTPSPSSRTGSLPLSGLCLHLAGIKSEFGQRHLPAEPHDLPVHQLHCNGGREGGKKHQNISKEGTAGHQLLLCCAPSIPKGEKSRTGPIRSPLTSSTPEQRSQEAGKQGRDAPLLPSCFLFVIYLLLKDTPTPVTPNSSSQFLPVASTESIPLEPALTILPHQALLDVADVGEEVAHCCDLSNRGKEGKKKRNKDLRHCFGASNENESNPCTKPNFL